MDTRSDLDYPTENYTRQAAGNVTMTPEASTEEVNAGFDVRSHVLFRVGMDMYPIYTIILVIFGTIGNVLSLMVLSRRAMRASSSSVYLCALAVSDTGCLWIHTLAMAAQTYDVVKVIVSPWFCRWFFFTMNSVMAISSWLVVAMTFERFLVVTFPLKAPVLVSKSKAKICVGTLSVAAILLDVYAWWMTTAVGPLCRYDRENYKTFLKSYALFESSVVQFVPVILVLILNCLIIGQTSKSFRNRKSLTSNPNSNKDNTGRKPSSQTNNIASTLLSVSIAFFIFQLPNALYIASFDFWMDWNSRDIYALAALLQSVSNFCLLLNYSTNFILYCLTGSRFREDLKQMFCTKHRQSHGAGHMTTQMTSLSVSRSTRDVTRTLQTAVSSVTALNDVIIANKSPDPQGMLANETDNIP